MIGLIVTGHGNFGSGLTSSLNLIAGEQENYQYVDFTKEVDKFMTDATAKDLAEAAVNTGKDQILRYEFKPVVQETSEDGI